MKNRDIIVMLETLAPKELACDWDNTGLQVGSSDKELTGVYVALDATPETVQEAVRLGCSLLVTHHPLLFSPIRSVRWRPTACPATACTRVMTRRSAAWRMWLPPGWG